MKKLWISLICLLLLSSVAAASPLTDYSAGKGSIDFIWRSSENTSDGTFILASTTFPKINDLDASITFGLGNNFAFQYRTFSPQSGQYVGIFNLTNNYKEYNLLYKLNKNFSVFSGVMKTNYEAGVPGISFSAPSKNVWQLGVVGNTKIGPKTNLWGTIAAGKSLNNYSVGISYEMAPSWEITLDYRYISYGKYAFFVPAPFEVTSKTKGLGLGLTCKF